MSDANKGLSGRKRRLGGMREIISLAAIFLIALSAQASAKTYLICTVTVCGVQPGTHQTDKKYNQ